MWLKHKNTYLVVTSNPHQELSLEGGLSTPGAPLTFSVPPALLFYWATPGPRSQSATAVSVFVSFLLRASVGMVYLFCVSGPEGS